MLADVDVRWKVANFNRVNMQKIEALWPQIEQAIRLAVETISGFGFTGKTLASANAVIPIVYYLFQRGSPPGFADSAAFKSDRQVIQRWLNIVLLKRTFGGVPDNVPRRMREVIKANHDSFPDAAIATQLEATPFALSFRKGELETLLDGKSRRPIHLSVAGDVLSKSRLPSQAASGPYSPPESFHAGPAKETRNSR